MDRFRSFDRKRFLHAPEGVRVRPWLAVGDERGPGAVDGVDLGAIVRQRSSWLLCGGPERP